MPVVVAIQGFRMQRDDLRNFLVSDGLSSVESTGLEPFEEDDDGIRTEEEDEIVAWFSQKGINCNLKIVIPWSNSWDFDPSPWVFISFNWVYLLSNRRLDTVLNKPVPTSFENLRQMLQVQSPICQYLLHTNYPLFILPIDGLQEELSKVSKATLPRSFFFRSGPTLQTPVTCDKCGLVFRASDPERHPPRLARSRHRGVFHGCQSSFPLPEDM